MNIPVTIQQYADEQASIRAISFEDEARHHAASAENLEILAAYQAAFDVAMDAHMAGKVGSPQEAIEPLLEMHRLTPRDPMIDRDFLNGDLT